MQTWILPEPDRWDVDGIRPLRGHLQERVDELVTTLGSQRPSSLAEPDPTAVITTPVA